VILDLIFGRRSAENPAHPYWDGVTDYGVKSDSGLDISYASALKYSPWWRGINLISRDVAKLPLYVYKRNGEAKDRDLKHPSYALLRRKANPELTSFTFIQTLTANAMSCGNGYAYIVRDKDARPQELRWLDPLATYPIRQNGVLSYVTMINSSWQSVARNDVLHVRGMGYDGLCGYPVYKVAADSLGLGIGAQKFGSVFFRNNAKPSVVIEVPGVMQKEAQMTFLEQWNRANAGLENAHRAAILTMGAKVNPFSMNAKDSMLLETREFEIREVANWLGVPPHKLGDTTRTAYASLEQENHSYLVEALDPWLCTWENECNDKLLTEGQKENESHFTEFNRNALVRASFAERMAGYNTALQGGWMNRNEVRAKENMNPLDGTEGEKFFVPLNMAEVGGGMEPPKIQGGTLDALQAIIVSIVKGEIPPEAGKVMIQAAYPGLEEKDIDAMITAAEETEPPAEPQPVAAMGQPAEPAEEPEEEGERAAMACVDGELVRIPFTATITDKNPPAVERTEFVLPIVTAEFENCQRELHADVADRMTKRLAIASRKAAKKPTEFLTWLDDDLCSHVPIVTDALEPVVKAWRALGHDGPPADELSATFVAKWSAALLEHSGRCTHDTMATYMDGAITELEKTLKQSLITMIGD
jgi:HK97 family phage portal protein